MADALDSSIAFRLHEAVADLAAALLERHPRMPTLLREIHQTLQKYPECVTLASEEEIATVFEGLKRQTGVEFAIAASSGKTSASSNVKKAIAQKGLDAF